MTAYDVVLKTSSRGRQRAELIVHGPTYVDAQRLAAFIFDVPPDIIVLEVLA